MSVALVHYDAMCREIETTHKLDEAKDIRDKAMALEVYARQAKNLEAEDRCKEIRLRAERKWGQLYSAAEKDVGGRPAKNLSNGTTGFGAPQTLSGMGVSRDQSSRWQKLGAVSDDEFEAAVAGKRVEQLIAEPRDPIEPVGADVLWLWGRLRDFRDRGLLEKTPDELSETATKHMLVEIVEIAPLVAAWLSQWSRL